MVERSMQVSEPARTEKYEKYVGAGMSEQQAREKAYERTLWATKSNFFHTYEEFLEATVQLEEDDTHQEIIADIEEKMRRGLDTSKAVKRVLPKHKHHFESLFEYKLDDEDANDSYSDSLEDVLDQPPSKRMGPFPSYWRHSDTYLAKDYFLCTCEVLKLPIKDLIWKQIRLIWTFYCVSVSYSNKTC